MQLNLSIIDGALVLATRCAECSEPVYDSLPLEVAVSRLREGAGKVGNALLGSLVSNIELALPEGAELIDSEWSDVVAWCKGCAAELEALREEGGT